VPLQAPRLRFKRQGCDKRIALLIKGIALLTKAAACRKKDLPCR